MIIPRGQCIYILNVLPQIVMNANNGRNWDFINLFCSRKLHPRIGGEGRRGSSSYQQNNYHHSLERYGFFLLFNLCGSRMFTRQNIHTFYHYLCLNLNGTILKIPRNTPKFGVVYNKRSSIFFWGKIKVFQVFWTWPQPKKIRHLHVQFWPYNDFNFVHFWIFLRPMIIIQKQVVPKLPLFSSKPDTDKLPPACSHEFASRYQ